MPRYRVCVSVSIGTLEHETFVTADDEDKARDIAISEAEILVNESSLDTSYDAWQCEECDEEDEARIKAEDGYDDESTQGASTDATPQADQETQP